MNNFNKLVLKLAIIVDRYNLSNPILSIIETIIIRYYYNLSLYLDTIPSSRLYFYKKVFDTMLGYLFYKLIIIKFKKFIQNYINEHRNDSVVDENIMVGIDNEELAEDLFHYERDL